MTIYAREYREPQTGDEYVLLVATSRDVLDQRTHEFLRSTYSGEEWGESNWNFPTFDAFVVFAEDLGYHPVYGDEEWLGLEALLEEQGLVVLDQRGSRGFRVRASLKRRANIKKCQPEDKKPGRKYPESEQEYCLWSKEDPDDLLMAGPKKAVEKHEQDIHYFKNAAAAFTRKRTPALIVGGQIFRRAALQLFIPAPRPSVDFRRRTAATKREVEKWASQVYKYTHQLEDEAEKSLEQIRGRGKVIGQLSGFFEKSLKSKFPTAEDIMEKVKDLADQYGSEGARLIEYSNVLAEVVRQRIRWAGIVGDMLWKLYDAGYDEDEPLMNYLREAAASLDLPTDEEAAS